ncbi:hypothetical protein C2G38_2030051 [Gigaspora rosea]|uniref:Uncharacterized protein n=1 Tax=Gigaspora rosea TaxID=44941 RepID=A0A397W070_9GLOM|nr:hypothetical protein C2G38_2030051 [Gigaspora rosea]
MSNYCDNSYEEYPISPPRDVDNAKSDNNTTVEHDPRACSFFPLVANYFDDNYEEFSTISVDIVKSDDNTTVEHNDDSRACYCDDSYENFPIGPSGSIENVKSDANAIVKGYCSDNYAKFPTGPSRSVDNVKSNDNTIAESYDNPIVKCHDDLCACSFFLLVADYCDASYEEFPIDPSRIVDNTAV